MLYSPVHIDSLPSYINVCYGCCVNDVKTKPRLYQQRRKKYLKKKPLSQTSILYFILQGSVDLSADLEL